MTERLHETTIRRRRKERLDALKRALQGKMGDIAFVRAWEKGRLEFEANMSLWRSGRIASPYTLEMPDDVRRQRLAGVRDNADEANVVKLYQAFRKWEQGD